MEEPDSKTPILYRPTFFFWCVGLLPIFIFVGSIILNMKQEHYKTQSTALISESVTQLPECRLFSVGMNIITWLSLPLYLIIDRVIKLKARIEKIDSSAVSIARFIMNICAGIAFFSELGLAAFTLKMSLHFHIFCVIVFVFSITVFFVLCDLGMKMVRLRITPIYWIWDVLSPLLIIISVGVILNVDNQNQIWSAAALIQYIGASMIFLKFILIWKALPKIGLLLTRRPN